MFKNLQVMKDKRKAENCFILKENKGKSQLNVILDWTQTKKKISMKDTIRTVGKI